jgi:hypothetical protein
MPDSDAGRDHVAQHLDRVMLDHAQVGDAARGDFLQQAADAGGVHLDAKVVVLRVPLGDGGRGFPHAAADFEDAVGAAAEYGVEVERRRLVGNAPARHAFFMEAALRVGDAAWRST